MNSQIDIFKKKLEEIANHGRYKFRTGRSSITDEFNPGYSSVAVEVAEDLLENFPEEDNRHTKAYRAAMFLLGYIDEENLERDDLMTDLPLERELLRVRSHAEPKATEKIVARLEEDKVQDELLGPSYVIHDPISKMNQEISAPAFDEKSSRAEHLAQTILEESI
jgi:hypothetical protein